MLARYSTKPEDVLKSCPPPVPSPDAGCDGGGPRQTSRGGLS